MDFEPSLKRTKWMVAPFGAILLGLILRVHNLNGARFINSDEYRAFYVWWGNVACPFFSLICGIPAKLFGTYHHFALFNSAVIGTISILVTFWVARDRFNVRTGVYASFILAVTVLHVRFSRSALPCAWQTFLILIAFWRLQSLFVKDRYYPSDLIISGVCLGLAFLTYIPSYSSIAAFFLLLFIKYRHFPIRLRLQIYALFTASVAILPMLYAIQFTLQPGPPDYVDVFLFFRDYTKAFITPEMATIPITFFKHYYYLGGVLQLLLTATAIVYCFFSWTLWKNQELSEMLTFILVSYFVFSFIGILKGHTLFLRHYIYLVPFFSICAGYFLCQLANRVGTKLIAVFLLCFLSISVAKSYDFTKETFKIEPIEGWLSKNNIRKVEVLTWLDLSHKWDYGVSYGTGIPGKFAGEVFLIDWKEVVRKYQTSHYRYLMTSGIRLHYTVGWNDKVLEQLTPLQQWRHPFRHLPNPDNRIQDFSIYRIEDILNHFSPVNQ